MRFKLRKIRFEFSRFFSREEGQDLVEYALVIALISVAAITSLHTLANKIVNTFNAIGNGL
jgi:pilus assembly protein Flp/PilA